MATLNYNLVMTMTTQADFDEMRIRLEGLEEKADAIEEGSVPSSDSDSHALYLQIEHLRHSMGECIVFGYARIEEVSPDDSPSLDLIATEQRMIFS